MRQRHEPGSMTGVDEAAGEKTTVDTARLDTPGVGTPGVRATGIGTPTADAAGVDAPGAAPRVKLPQSGPGRLYVIAAPSGAGKTSLVKALMQREPRMRFSVSYTTRAPRPNEVDGRDYHFVTQACFDAMVARGDFLEHAKVFDNCYGTGLRAVQADLRDGQLLLLEIDWQGARQVRERLPAARSIFILPPARRTLEERLRARSTDSEAVIERRLKDAAQDLAHWTEFDYVVVNDQFERAVADLLAIVNQRGDPLAVTRPEVARFAAGLLGP